jgi:hypothetical protein
MSDSVDLTRGSRAHRAARRRLQGVFAEGLAPITYALPDFFASWNRGLPDTAFVNASSSVSLSASSVGDEFSSAVTGLGDAIAASTVIVGETLALNYTQLTTSRRSPAR